MHRVVTYDGPLDFRPRESLNSWKGVMCYTQPHMHFLYVCLWFMPCMFDNGISNTCGLFIQSIKDYVITKVLVIWKTPATKPQINCEAWYNGYLNVKLGFILNGMIRIITISHTVKQWQRLDIDQMILDSWNSSCLVFKGPLCIYCVLEFCLGYNDYQVKWGIFYPHCDDHYLNTLSTNTYSNYLYCRNKQEIQHFWNDIAVPSLEGDAVSNKRELYCSWNLFFFC